MSIDTNFEVIIHGKESKESAEQAGEIIEELYCPCCTNPIRRRHKTVVIDKRILHVLCWARWQELKQKKEKNKLSPRQQRKARKAERKLTKEA